MKIAYIDCYSGISGDMLLGGLIDCGVKVSELKKELAKLKIKGVDIRIRQVKRGHITGTKVDIVGDHLRHFHNLKEVLNCLNKSKLEISVKKIAVDVFTILAKAEAKVHRQKLDTVHFHQLGSLDTIVDVVGCILAIKMLGVEKVYASAVTLGSGKVQCGKDVFPLPAPATLQLLKDRTVFIDASLRHETVTPTGAALLSALTHELPAHFPLQVKNVGYGAGSYSDDKLANLLTVMVAESEEKYLTDRITVIEANIDDILPLNFEILFERLFGAGALDVYTVPVMMKKMRQGTLLHVQVSDEKFIINSILSVIFTETTTIGVRITSVSRRKLTRKTLKLKTNYGIIVRVKIAQLSGGIVNIAPEYEDCKKIALQKNKSFKLVYDTIKAQAVKEFRQL